MKKVLLASTALAAMSGAAYAEVTISGSASMGIYDDGVNPDTQFYQDIDVNFSMSGETDNGLSFGASVDLDENGAFAPHSHGGASVFISGDFGTVTMGDTDGALDWAMTEVGGAASIAEYETGHAGYSGNSALDGSVNDGQVLRYDHSVGDFAFALSYTQDVAGGSGATASGPSTECAPASCGDAIGVGVKGSFGDFGVGVGYQENDVTSIAGVSLSYSMGDISAVLNYSDWDIGGSDADHMAVGVTYSMGAMSLHANWGEYDFGSSKNDGIGVSANYDLGGGAVVKVGYGSGSIGGAPSLDRWSLGLAMSF